MASSIRIGAGQGFYGDTADGALDVARAGDVRYICCDALAELTMTILARDRAADAALGYTRDLPRFAERLLPVCGERGIRLVTNAGGLNPPAAAAAVARVAHRLGMDGLRIATVTGDDIAGRLDDLDAAGASLRHLDTDESLEIVRPHVVAANAYLGARPIVDALERGADVVVTGRVADASLFVAPVVHELGWGWEDWDRLAGAVVAGHLMECSGQATGGNFSGDWWD
ncbi:MAG TPA: acyclic terpene utilization AtuA family protein, partial [Candidatus Dormibacteraeota bacterium]|nr:acyclic terpene utilization AtuA family protein [Candidatus Dormibacteraeota bacterium]